MIADLLGEALGITPGLTADDRVFGTWPANHEPRPVSGHQLHCQPCGVQWRGSIDEPCWMECGRSGRLLLLAVLP